MFHIALNIIQLKWYEMVFSKMKLLIRQKNNNYLTNHLINNIKNSIKNISKQNIKNYFDKSLNLLKR